MLAYRARGRCELGCLFLVARGTRRDVFLHSGARPRAVRSRGRLAKYLSVGPPTPPEESSQLEPASRIAISSIYCIAALGVDRTVAMSRVLWR